MQNSYGNIEQVHAYERSNRVYNYTLDPWGPVYITVGDGGNREKMAITHADEAGNCPEPSTTPDDYMGGFCAFNFTSGPAAGKFCWDRQPDYSAFRESSFGHGILEVILISLSTHIGDLSFMFSIWMRLDKYVTCGVFNQKIMFFYCIYCLRP